MIQMNMCISASAVITLTVICVLNIQFVDCIRVREFKSLRAMEHYVYGRLKSRFGFYWLFTDPVCDWDIETKKDVCKRVFNLKSIQKLTTKMYDEEKANSKNYSGKCKSMQISWQHWSMTIIGKSSKVMYPCPVKNIPVKDAPNGKIYLENEDFLVSSGYKYKRSKDKRKKEETVAILYLECHSSFVAVVAVIEDINDPTEDLVESVKHSAGNQAVDMTVSNIIVH